MFRPTFSRRPGTAALSSMEAKFMLFFDDDGPKSLVRSTLTVKMFLYPVIPAVFTIIFSLSSGGAPVIQGPGHQP